MVGKKGSGKSHLFLKLLLNPQGYCCKYDRIIFVSPTFRTQFEGLWKALDPKGIKVYEDMSDGLLAQIISEQETSDTTCLCVFDDLGEIWKHIDQSVLNRFISNSRHLRLSMVFLAQKLSQLSTIIRANTDCFVTFSACSQIELEALYREVSVVEKKQFLSMFRVVTRERFAFLCISIIGGKIGFYPNFGRQITV